MIGTPLNKLIDWCKDLLVDDTIDLNGSAGQELQKLIAAAAGDSTSHVNADLMGALESLRSEDGCWCSTGDGNPHTAACLAATRAYAQAEGRTMSEPTHTPALLLAAPDLLDALKFVHDHIADPARSRRDLYPAFGLDAGRAIEMVSAAISKAEGRS